MMDGKSALTTTQPSQLAAAVHEQVSSVFVGAEPSPFSPTAFKELEDSINEFIGDLVDESLKIAKRHQSEFVSANYVRQASEHLIASRTKRVFRHLGTVGGILLGGAMSNILAMAQAGTTFPIVGTLVSVGVGLVGSFLVAMHIAKD
jgi:hypothetical protein